MKVQDNVIKDMGRLMFWYPIRWMAGLFSFGMIRLIGKITGFIDYYLFRGRSERIKRNLLHAFGDRMTDQRACEIVRKILANHYILILEFFKYPQINEKNLKTILDIEGLENIDNALRQGRGAIIGHCHFGAKLLLIIALGLKKYPINQIAYHMPQEKLTLIRETVSLRQRLRIEKGFNVNYIYLDNSMREAFSCLEDNEVLMVAVDGKGEFSEEGRTFVPVKFFGRTVFFPGGLAAFSKRKRTPVLPAAVFRLKDGRYKLIIHPPLDMDYHQPRSEFNRTVIGRLAGIFEEDIRLHPDQWEYWEEFGPDPTLRGGSGWVEDTPN